MSRKPIFTLVILSLLAGTGGVCAQCTILPGQTETVTSPVACGAMSIAGTLIIESTGSVTGADGSTLNGPGATITVNGGSFHCTGRFNVGQGSDGYINLNGGTFTVDGTWKYPDESGGVHRMWVNAGLMQSNDIELRGDRDAIIYIGGGVLRLTGGDFTTHPDIYYNPFSWISEGWLQPAPGYDSLDVQYVSAGNYTEITAMSQFPRVEFETASSGNYESVSPATLTLTMSQAESVPVTVDYGVAGGTAEGNGVDYTLLGSGTLTFDPCETTETISIEIVNDGNDENDETIEMILSNVTGGSAMLGVITQHTYVIYDPRPGVAFTTPAGSGLESTTPAVVEVSLSWALPDAVTVNYAATGGTATSGADYILLGDGTLAFDPWQTTQQISMTILDDHVEELPDETVQLTLSDPSPNVKLGFQNQHTYTIIDNEQGVLFDDLTWYYSRSPNPLYVNQDNQLVWVPEKGEQFITRLPEQSLSIVGDKVEISYWWMTDGAHNCPDCYACPDGCYDDSIECIAGTSDMRAGLFEADGEYITGDGFSVSSSVFAGYKGYAWRFGPNMIAGPTRWVDCTGEVHKTGNFQKKIVDSDNLMTINEGLEDYIPGFELAPGEWSLWTVSLERTASDTVISSITLNDRTYTWTDGSSSGQPDRIDVFAIHMRNGRPYSVLALEPLWRPSPGDFDENGVVDGNDLGFFTLKWLKRCRVDTYCEGRDINQDWVVNFKDFVLMAAHWLELNPR